MSKMEHEQPSPSPKQRMEDWEFASEFAIKKLGVKIPLEVLEAHDQALYIAARANAPGANPDHAHAASTSGFRESEELAELEKSARRLSDNA